MPPKNARALGSGKIQIAQYEIEVPLLQIPRELRAAAGHRHLGAELAQHLAQVELADRVVLGNQHPDRNRAHVPRLAGRADGRPEHHQRTGRRSSLQRSAAALGDEAAFRRVRYCHHAGIRVPERDTTDETSAGPAAPAIDVPAEPVHDLPSDG